MNQVKIGIVGLGNMGSSHYRNIAANIPQARVTAVCDINPAALEHYPELPAEAKFTDPAAFFDRADMDAVIVATPHFFHHTLGIAALDHGKHLLVEKPISVHKALALELISAIERHPELKVSAMFNQRTLPVHRKLKELIDGGEFGKIKRINWTITNWFRSQTYYDSGDWRATWRGEGGGVLTNQCPHQLDLMQWFFGMPERVTAFAYFGKHHDIEVEDEITAYLEYPGGATGTFIASTAEAPGSNRLEIAADRGKVVFENGQIHFKRTEVSVQDYLRTTTQRFAPPPIWEIEIPVTPDTMNQHGRILQNFADAILHDTPLIAPAREGIRGLELGNSMLLSAWKQSPVTLPINPDEYAAELDKRIAVSRYKVKTFAPKNGASNDEFNHSF